MPRHNHPDFGDVTDTSFFQGVIQSVDTDTETCDIIITYPDIYGGGNHAFKSIPVFYHCDSASTVVPSGGLDGATGAFQEDDDVVVLMEGLTPKYVVAHVDKKVPCCGGIITETFDFTGGVSVSPDALTMSVDHTMTMEPEIPYDFLDDIPQSFPDPPSEPESIDIKSVSIMPIETPCSLIGIGTSYSGVSGGVDSFAGINMSDSGSAVETSYGYNFQTFWDHTVAASCPNGGPHCGEKPDPATITITAAGGGPAKTDFNCADAAESYAAKVTMTFDLPGHTTLLSECDPAGCGTNVSDLTPEWSLSQSPGAGWTMYISGNNAVVKPPPCKCNATCDGATLTAITPGAFGPQISTFLTLAVSGCGSTSMTVTGATQTNCSGTYQYNAEDDDGNSMSNVTWSVVGGGTISLGGLYTPPASNPGCTNNAVITADWECPKDPTVQLSDSMSVANQCYTLGGEAFIKYCCLYQCRTAGAGYQCTQVWKQPVIGGVCGGFSGRSAQYNCSGTYYGTRTGGPGCSPPNNAPCFAGGAIGGPCGPTTHHTVDTRTAQLINAGCCPDEFV